MMVRIDRLHCNIGVQVLGEVFNCLHRAQLGSAAARAPDPALPQLVRVPRAGSSSSLSGLATPQDPPFRQQGATSMVQDIFGQKVQVCTSSFPLKHTYRCVVHVVQSASHLSSACCPSRLTSCELASILQPSEGSSPAQPYTTESMPGTPCSTSLLEQCETMLFYMCFVHQQLYVATCMHCYRPTARQSGFMCVCSGAVSC